MLTYAQALILGALQGTAELFPVSSLGHSLLIPPLLGWGIDQSAPEFVAFLIYTHLATALVLIAFFWQEWRLIIRGFFRSLAARSLAGDPPARFAWLLVVGTVPVGLIGLIFQKKVEALFADPKLVAAALFLNGIVLLGAEWLRRRSARADLASLSLPASFGIGIAQALALIPGFSRTGSSLSGGLLAGLSHEESAHFAFLLAAPVIFAAAALKLPSAIHEVSAGEAGPLALGVIFAALGAYLSVRFLSRYFKTKTLTPFAVYCLIAGLIAFFAL